MSSWKVIIIASAALSFALNGKQDYVQIPIPVPAGHVAEPVALNEQGQALVTDCAQSVPAQCAAILWTQRRGAVTVLFYQSGTAAQFKLNDWGQVAAIRAVNPPAQTVALWSPWDGWRDIARFPQGGASLTALNNLGVALGQTAQGAFLATRWLGAQFIPALAGNVTLKDLNDLGVVTGTIAVPCPPNSCSGGMGHAFRWTPWSGLEDLDQRSVFARPQSDGLSVNRFGDVAGIRFFPEPQHPFLRTDREGVRDINSLGRLNAFIVLNDHRELIGRYYYGTTVRSLFWSEKTGTVDIGTLGGITNYAQDLNNKGQVVGISSLQSIGPNNAYVWSQAAGITDLGSGSPIQINDDGLILGRGGPTGVCVWTR